MKISLLKYFDRLAGGFLIAGLPSLPMRSFTRSGRFLIIRPGGIGDAVLLIPLILLVKKEHPEAQITVLAEKRNAAVFRLCPAINSILCYDNLTELLTAVCGSYDVVVDTEQWHCLSAVVARMTGSSVLIGFSTNDRRKLFNHAIPYFQDDYEVESFHRLLAPINLNNSQPVSVPYLHIYPELEHQADALLGQHAKTLFVVIFPGASISEKRWEADKFRQLVIQLGGVGVNAVLIGGKNDVDAAQIIVAGTDALNLAGKTSLVETAAVIARGAVLVSGDSGVLHMAVGLGKSTVSLFGPSSIKKWSPKGGDHVVIHRNLQCSPCSQFGHTPRCKIKAKCMSEITVDEALDAVIKLLKQQSELC